MDENPKNYSKLISSDQIRSLAKDWSLAGDVGLLAYLEQLSENICSKTQSTQLLFNELINNYDTLQSNIHNTTNKFLALQNGQFVENRVYDEETPTEEKSNEKGMSEDEKEHLLLMQYKEAVEIGLKLLDTHFYKVELPPNSDSDEEDVMTNGNTSHIWKPKNPYSENKFPFIIGSTEWWADDNVGLGNLEENLDIDKAVSDSESDLDLSLNVDKKIQLSSSSSMENIKFNTDRQSHLETSTEELFNVADDSAVNSNDKNHQPEILRKNSLIAENPALSDNVNVKEYNHSETNEDKILQAEESGEMKSPKMIQKAFMEELASKLGCVEPGDGISNFKDSIPYNEKNKFTEESTRKKEIIFDDIFNTSEEGEVNLFSEKTPESSFKKNYIFFDSGNDSQLFSESDQLFFDSESNLFNSSERTFLRTNNVKNKLEDAGPKIEKEITLNKNSVVKETDNLFSETEEYDSLFSSKSGSFGATVNSSKSCLMNSNEKREFIGDIEVERKRKSESIFDLNDDEFNDPDSIFDQKKNSEIKNSELNRKSRLNRSSDGNDKENIRSLMSEEQKSSPLASESKSFSIQSPCNAPPKKPSNNLFDLESDAADDLFTFCNKNDNIPEKSVPPTLKVIGTIDDEDNSLFLYKSRLADSNSISSSRSSLFDDVNATKSRLSSVFDRDKQTKFEDDSSIFGENVILGQDENDLFSAKRKNEINESQKTSLFGEFDDEDDLFTFVKGNSGVLPLEKVQEVFRKVENKPESDHLTEVDGFDCKTQQNVLSKEIFVSEAIEEDLFSDIKNNSIQTKENILVDDINDSLFGEAKGEIPNQKKVAQKITSDSAENNDFFHKPKSRLSEIASQYSFGNDVNLNKDILRSSSVGSSEAKQSSSLNPGADLDRKTNSLGKLNISNTLKSKLESVVKNVPIDKKNKRVEVDANNQNKDIERSENSSVTLLKCPSKDRVKIPVKRRPQSRRARQEAIRNAENTFLEPMSGNKENVLDRSYSASSKTSLSNKDSENPELSSDLPDIFSSSTLSNPLSPSTDEEDFFNVPELDKNFEKEDQSIFQDNLFQSKCYSNIQDSLFDDEVDSRNIKAPVICESEKTEKDTSLFETSSSNSKPRDIDVFNFNDEDGDSDTNLFKWNNSLKSKGKSSDDHYKRKKSRCPKSDDSKPLFESSTDEDDDDDLFGGKTTFSTKKPTERPTSQGSDILAKGDENSKVEKDKERKGESFVDPLGLMSSNDL